MHMYMSRSRRGARFAAESTRDWGFHLMIFRAGHGRSPEPYKGPLRPMKTLLQILDTVRSANIKGSVHNFSIEAVAEKVYVQSLGSHEALAARDM